MTLNMLRQAHMNANISSYTHCFGVFDFNRTPLAPPDTKVVIHSKPSKWGTWDPNGKIGYYVGPVINHYRYFKCIILKLKQKSQLIQLFSYHTKFQSHLHLFLIIFARLHQILSYSSHVRQKTTSLLHK